MQAFDEGVDFRKPFKLGAGNLLKSSQLRKLVAQHGLRGDYSAGLQMQKLLGTKRLLYSRQGEPLFFQEHSSGPVFPTVYALWDGAIKVANVETSEGAFESVARGSDLFRPGVLAVTGDSFTKGQPVSLSVNGRVVAVCKACMGREEMTEAVAGSVLEPMHAYGDALWKLGSKRDPPAELSVAEDETRKQSENVPEESVPEEVAAVAVSAGEMDNLSRETFVRALKLHLAKTDLPMLFSTFFSKCMLPAVPEGKVLNMKQVGGGTNSFFSYQTNLLLQTSFKKIGPFLQQMAAEKVIKINEKSAGVFEIVEIDRGAPLYRSFKVEKSVEEESSKSDVPPVVECLYRLPKRLQNVFPDERGEGDDGLMSKSEARALLLGRVKERKLLQEGKSGGVALDEELLAALKGAQAVMKMPDLLSVWFDSLDVFSRIYEGNVPVVKRGLLKPIALKEEHKASKAVTVVEGLQRFGIDSELFASICAHKFAASASVAEQVVQVQGSRGEEIAAMLKGSDFRVSPEYITIAAKKPSKKKK